MRYIIALIGLLVFEHAGAQENSSWKVIDSSEGTTFSFIHRSIDCYDADNCVYVADSAGVLSVARTTTDGGVRWKTVLADTLDLSILKFPRRYIAVAMPSPSKIVILMDSSEIISTQDAGKTWSSTRYTFPVGRLTFLDFSDSVSGYAGGPAKWLFYSPDGGATWRTTSVIPDSLSYKTVSASNGKFVAVMHGRDSIRHVSRSIDNGAGWITSIAPDYLNDFDFANASHGWAVGSIPIGTGNRKIDYIVRTIDSGRSWTEVHREWNDPAMGLSHVSFADTLNGVAVGGGGKILRTRDGGKSWERQFFNCDTLNSSCGIGEVVLVNSTVGYAIAGYGRILKYSRSSDVVRHENESDLKSADLVVYTDKSNAGINIEFLIDKTTTTKGWLAELYTLSGELIDSKRVDANVRQTVGAEIPSGMYVIRVTSGATILTRIVVVTN